MTMAWHFVLWTEHRTQKQTEGAMTVNRGGGNEKKEREDRKRLGWDGMGWGEELELTLIKLDQK
jgi:hypothetical protein